MRNVRNVKIYIIVIDKIWPIRYVVLDAKERSCESMLKTDHFMRRATERGIDDISVLILQLYGERLGRRGGIALRREVADELRQIALNSIRNAVPNKEL